MAFRVKTLRTGEYFTFTAKQILHLIGDSVNDEIVIDGETFRISTCHEIETGTGVGGNIDWQAEAVVIPSNGESAFYFPVPVLDTQSLFLTVNNVLYNYGIEADFHIEGDRLYWHGRFPLETDDEMIIRYPSPIN